MPETTSGTARTVRWTPRAYRLARRAKHVGIVVAVLASAALADCLLWLLPTGAWSR